MGEHSARALWKISTSLKCSPSELLKTFTPLQWQWAFHNYNADIEEQIKLVEACYELLQPWMNPQLYSTIRKKKELLDSPSFKSYVEELRGRGVGEDEIERIIGAQGGQVEEFDQIEFVQAPGLTPK